MSPREWHFTTLRESRVSKIWLADDHSVPCVGEGDIWVRGESGPVCIRGVLFAPQLSAPLFSVSKVYDAGGRVAFGPEVVELFCAGHKEPCLIGERLGSGWYVPVRLIEVPSAKGLVPKPSEAQCLKGKGATQVVCTQPFASAVRGCDPTKATGSWRVWHARLAHLGWQQLKRLVTQKLASGIEVSGAFPSDTACEACLEGKMHQHPFAPASSRATRPLELVHTDLMGPVNKRSRKGHHKYIMVIVDDFTRYGWVYFLRRKSQAPERLKNFIRMVERQFAAKVATVRSDRGGEYLANRLTTWFDKLGIHHHLSIPDTPQQNGVAERYNRTLQERGRSMLLAAGLPTHFWGHAVRYACWLSNRLPHTAVRDPGIPYTALRGKAPNLAMAKVFGCLAQVWIDPRSVPKSWKFHPRAQWAVFLGVSSQSKAWEFFLPASEETDHLSRNAFFYEDLFFKDLKAKQGEGTAPGETGPSVDAGPGERTALSDPVEFTAPLFTPPRSPLVPSGTGAPEAVIQGEIRRHEPTLPWDEVRVDEVSDAGAWPSPPSSEGDSLSDTQNEGAPQKGESSCEPLDPSAEDSSSDSSTSESSSEESDEPVRQRPVRERRPPERYTPAWTVTRRQDPPAVRPTASSELSSNSSEDLPGITTGPRGMKPLSSFKGARGSRARGSNPLTVTWGLPLTGKPAIVRTSVASGGDTWRKGLRRRASSFVTLSIPKWEVPNNLKQADASVHSKEWLEARHVEMGRLLALRTWDLVEPPPDANVLGSRWVFDIKTNPDGTIERFKARLVCQGFGQIEGVDFDDTYANTAGKATVRLFLALICCLGLRVKQMDVSTAFLYGDIDKEIYMRQPQGFEDGSGRACKLRRSIYGLKQAPRIWEETLRKALHGIGFKSSALDPCLFILQKDGDTLFLLDFVDDMLLASHSTSLLEWVSKELCKAFTMKDLGEAQRYVGLHIAHDREAGEMWVH